MPHPKTFFVNFVYFDLLQRWDHLSTVNFAWRQNKEYKRARWGQPEMEALSEGRHVTNGAGVGSDHHIFSYVMCNWNSGSWIRERQESFRTAKDWKTAPPTRRRWPPSSPSERPSLWKITKLAKWYKQLVLKYTSQKPNPWRWIHVAKKKGELWEGRYKRRYSSKVSRQLHLSKQLWKRRHVIKETNRHSEIHYSSNQVKLEIYGFNAHSVPPYISQTRTTNKKDRQPIQRSGMRVLWRDP